MSQNIFKTQLPTVGAVTVLAGWDRRTQALFCMVVTPDLEEDICDFSALQLMEFSDAHEIGLVLQGFGIALPDEMLTAIDQDCSADAGNVIREFSADGKIVEEVS